MEIAENVFMGIENADFETKRRNLEMLDVKIVVDSGQFNVTFAQSAQET